MAEDYCSYELSKLLKEKGFDWMCIGYYNKDDDDSEPYFGNSEGTDNWNNQAPSVKDLWCSAPTHQMAMKWLREVHKLFVDISFQKDEDDSVTWFYMTWALDDRKRDAEEVDFTSYEEAVEAAIKYCLTKVI